MSPGSCSSLAISSKRSVRSVGVDAAAVVLWLRRAALAIAQRGCPNQIAVSSHHGMRRGMRTDFVGEQRGVDTPNDDECSACADALSEAIAAKRVRRVDTD